MAFPRIPSILLALLLSAPLAQAAPAAPRIGVQLWSVKDDLKQDFEGTLAGRRYPGRVRGYARAGRDRR